MTNCCDWQGISCVGSAIRSITLQKAISGPIPQFFGTLNELRYLNLGGNDLNGTVPDLSGLKNLTFMWGYSSNFLGEIPPAVGNSPILRSLHFGNNSFTGALPVTLGNLAKLDTLHLEGNQLSGPIPPSLGQLSRLRELYLQKNLLTGAIPSSLVSLSNLTTLFLHNNKLSGPIGDMPSPSYNCTLIAQQNEANKFNCYVGKSRSGLCYSEVKLLSTTCPTPVTPSDPDQTSPTSSRPSTLIIALAVGAAVIVAAIAVFAALAIRHRRRRNQQQAQGGRDAPKSSGGLAQFILGKTVEPIATLRSDGGDAGGTLLLPSRPVSTSPGNSMATMVNLGDDDNVLQSPMYLAGPVPMTTRRTTN
ncbi:hypothetical protein BC828DRAFT_402784 [Blastocladiella britannica]|nr:hypothetical protein BC828DRAFT_402784 [Blastocladiella britannica]